MDGGGAAWAAVDAVPPRVMILERVVAEARRGGLSREGGRSTGAGGWCKPVAVLRARVWAGALFTCATAVPADETLPADVGRVLAGGGPLEADEGGHRVDDSRLTGSCAAAFCLWDADAGRPRITETGLAPLRVRAVVDVGGERVGPGLTGRRLGESPRFGSAGGEGRGGCALAVGARSVGRVEVLRRERVR